MNKRIFYFGLILFYLLAFFSPNKLIYFSTYFISTLSFYLATKNIRKSLLYSMIISLFLDFGIAQSLFIMNPEQFNLGPGYKISPTTVFVLALLPFTFFKKIKYFQKADLFASLFFTLGFTSFFIFPYTNVLFGIISLGEVILAYFILRIHLTKDDFKNISILIISLLIFQTVLSGIQFILQRPIGQVSETATTLNPYGITTVEEQSLFRITGTFSHPNFLASFILLIYPFIFLYPTVNIFLTSFKILALIILVFTYSRAAWIVFAIVIIPLLLAKQLRKKIPKVRPLYYYLTLIIIIGVFVALTPSLSTRFNSIPVAFEEFGSVGIRFKTYTEGINLVSNYPLTGVGYYRSIEEYANNPITDIFEKLPIGRFYGIHNTFLEIAAEIGIPGLIFFCLFLVFTLKAYFESDRRYPKNAAFYGLLGLLGMSMLNPFFHSSQFRLFFLLSAIILV